MTSSSALSLFTEIQDSEEDRRKSADLSSPPSGWQNAVLEGEDWKVTITSKHELETSSDLPHKTVTITPKIPAAVVEEEVFVEEQQVWISS
jgi:hypothetical protein